MSSIDLAALIPELATLINSRISNIYQIDNSIFLIKFRQPKGTLLIEVGKRIHPTKYVLEVPEKPSPFCMALRKYLRNGKIIGIRQLNFDRIIEIEIESRKEIYKLVCELFREGNIILVESEGNIIHALHYKKMRDRNIIRGEKYTKPPKHGLNLAKLEIEDLLKIKSFSNLEVVKGLAKFLGIGNPYVEEFLIRAGVNIHKPCEKLSEEELVKIYNAIKEITCSVLKGAEHPHIVINSNGEWIDVLPISLRKYENLNEITFERFSEALDEYYTRLLMERKSTIVKEERKRKLEKFNRILRFQEESLKRFREKSSEYRTIGMKIYEHFGEIQQLMHEIWKLKSKGLNWQNIEKEIKSKDVPPYIYLNSIKSDKGKIEVKIDEYVFEIGLRESPQNAALRYYTLAKKFEKKIEGILKAINDIKKKIKEFEAEAVIEIKSPEKIPEVKRKAWYENFRWFKSSDGFLVIAGKDARTNELLIKRYAEPNDIVLHADIPGAAFVLIKNCGDKPPENTLMEAAEYAASHSKAWKIGLASISVFWVKPNQLKKTPGVKVGAFTISGRRNYIRNVRLRLAIGVKIEKEKLKIICGPVNAVEKETKIFIVLVPGSIPANILSRKIRDILASKVPFNLRYSIMKLNLNEIYRLIPYGFGRILQL